MAAHPPKQGRDPTARAAMAGRRLAGDEAARRGALGKHGEVGDLFEVHRGGGAHRRGSPHGSGCRPVGSRRWPAGGGVEELSGGAGKRRGVDVVLGEVLAGPGGGRRRPASLGSSRRRKKARAAHDIDIPRAPWLGNGNGESEARS
jgi:hypothetical protein